LKNINDLDYSNLHKNTPFFSERLGSGSFTTFYRVNSQFIPKEIKSSFKNPILGISSEKFKIDILEALRLNLKSIHTRIETKKEENFLHFLIQGEKYLDIFWTEELDQINNFDKLCIDLTKKIILKSSPNSIYDLESLSTIKIDLKEINSFVYSFFNKPLIMNSDKKLLKSIKIVISSMDSEISISDISKHILDILEESLRVINLIMSSFNQKNILSFRIDFYSRQFMKENNQLLFVDPVMKND